VVEKELNMKTNGDNARKLRTEATARGIGGGAPLMALALELFPPDPYLVEADLRTDLAAWAAYLLASK
jgi:hypothetical protein